MRECASGHFVVCLGAFCRVPPAILPCASSHMTITTSTKLQKNRFRDDGQLMAIVETKVEGERLHLDPDFDTAALAKLIGVSKERLEKLFRNKSMYRTPEAYIDNLRLLAAMRLLREKPNYSIASISEDSGFKHVRTMQRKLVDALGLTPAEYRALYTRDL